MLSWHKTFQLWANISIHHWWILKAGVLKSMKYTVCKTQHETNRVWSLGHTTETRLRLLGTSCYYELFLTIWSNDYNIQILGVLRYLLPSLLFQVLIYYHLQNHGQSGWTQTANGDLGTVGKHARVFIWGHILFYSQTWLAFCRTHKWHRNQTASKIVLNSLQILMKKNFILFM